MEGFKPLAPYRSVGIWRRLAHLRHAAGNHRGRLEQPPLTSIGVTDVDGAGAVDTGTHRVIQAEYPAMRGVDVQPAYRRRKLP